MVNPEVEGSTKTPKHWKMLRKTQKDDNLLKTNEKNTKAKR